MAPLQPHKPRPMQPSGTVEPPNLNKKMSGKEKNRTKKEAERIVTAAINTPEFMVLTFHINPHTGAVVLNYRLADFPVSKFEEAAGLFAQVLTEQLGEMFGPQEQAEMRAAAESAKQTQTSEPLPSDAELNSIPTSLGG